MRSIKYLTPSVSYKLTFSWMGKLLITVTMFVGRLGPLTLGIVIIRGKREEERFELPEENVMIG